MDREGFSNLSNTGKVSREEAPSYSEKSVNAPVQAGRQPGLANNQPPDPRVHAQMRAVDGEDPGPRPGAEPEYRQAATREGVPDHRSLSARSGEPGASSFDTPGQEVEKGSVSATQPDGEQRRAGHQAQTASGTHLWSTRFLLAPLLDNSGSMIQQSQEMLRSLQSAAYEHAGGKNYGKSFTQRGPPPEIPTPFSGFGPMMGGAGNGSTSSSDGGAPLLAVIASCLFVLLCAGRSRSYNPFTRPGTVPRLALERPG